MKNILIVLILMSVGFASCDERKSKSVALKESIEAFDQNQSNPETISYYPKEYTEVVTDTLISNVLKIHIKNYSIGDETILLSSNKKSPKKKTYHRVFQSEIVVSTPSKTIFSAWISAAQFKGKSNDEFWNYATLEHAWVNQELSTSEKVQVDVTIINPKENSYKLFRMSIDAFGKQQINLIEENS